MKGKGVKLIRETIFLRVENRRSLARVNVITSRRDKTGVILIPFPYVSRSKKRCDNHLNRCKRENT